MDLMNGLLLRLRDRQMAQLSRRPKGQRVHILRPGRPALPLLDHLRARGLRLPHRLHRGHAHEVQQLLALLRLLLRGPHGPPLQLQHLFLVPVFGRLLKLRCGLLRPLLPTGQQLGFHLRGLPVEHVHRLQPLLQHADGARPHPLQVAGDLPLLVRQLPFAPKGALHRDQELVDAHAGVHGDLAPKVILHLVLLDRCRGLLGDELH
mmetsp:Transcript_3571/g.6851  ORF Transcript_3571/g.6851 Transcript_3571/m.6851 type:complete len:206 (+) Transcript_3571:694-1311(+)